MRMRHGRVLILLAAGLLAGCSTAPKLGDTAATNGASPDTTGSIVTQPAEPDTSAPGLQSPPDLSTPGLAGDDPNDDVSLGKKYFRSNDFGLAEKSFRSAVEKHPRDAEAWVGLAASYDRLRRFDLADRAYGEAFRLIGPTTELLNDEGFSSMLRGDYARARKMLQQAQARDPTNRYVQANLQLLDDSIRQHKAVQ
ncbi:MAG: tetratricopeptide repeat protein [Xanthobacteraceae bacterium]